VVAESLAVQFLHSDLEVECPGCQYPLWVTWAEVVVQAVVLCPCCRIRIQLSDAEGSLQNAARVVERVISQALKGLGN
jgi:hypothetical protein